MVVAAGAQGVSDVVQCLKDIIKHKVSGSTCFQLIHDFHGNIYSLVSSKVSLNMLECVN